MHSKRRLLLIGLLTFLIGVVALFPARVAVSWLAPSGIAVSNADGTVWSGSAARATVMGLYLQDLSWQFRPLSLLTGTLAYDVEATPAQGFIEARASVDLDGAVTLSDLDGAFPLAMLANVLGIPGLRGNASLRFERVRLVDGLPEALDGELQLADIVVPLVGNDSLGGYKAEFFTQNGGVSASVEDTDGVVDLAGSFELKSDRSYAFEAHIVRRADTPQSVARQLQFLPPPNDRGQQVIRLEGVL